MDRNIYGATLLAIAPFTCIAASGTPDISCLSIDQQDAYRTRLTELTTTFEVLPIAKQMRDIYPEVQASLERLKECQAAIVSLTGCARQKDAYNVLATQYNVMESHMELFSNTLQAQLSLINSALPTCSH